MLHATNLQSPTMQFLPSHALPPAHTRASAADLPPSPTRQRPWLLVGLGNPGKKYEGTRHNIGFEMIDAIAEAGGIKMRTIQQKALTGKGEIGSAQVLLAKPQTFINLVGESVAPLAAYYRIPVQQILVIFDDMLLEFGLLRLQEKGGHGSHNGMKSVMEHLKGCRDFARLRIGIGKPPGTMDPAAFVLQKFHTKEREEMDMLLSQGVDVIKQLGMEGIEKAANTCNDFHRSHMTLSEREAVKAALMLSYPVNS